MQLVASIGYSAQDEEGRGIIIVIFFLGMALQFKLGIYSWDYSQQVLWLLLPSSDVKTVYQHRPDLITPVLSVSLDKMTSRSPFQTT